MERLDPETANTLFKNKTKLKTLHFTELTQLTDDIAKIIVNLPTLKTLYLKNGEALTEEAKKTLESKKQIKVKYTLKSS